MCVILWVIHFLYFLVVHYGNGKLANSKKIITLLEVPELYVYFCFILELKYTRQVIDTKKETRKEKGMVNIKSWEIYLAITELKISFHCRRSYGLVLQILVYWKKIHWEHHNWLPVLINRVKTGVKYLLPVAHLAKLWNGSQDCHLRLHFLKTQLLSGSF